MPTPLQSYFCSGVFAFMGFLIPISRRNRSHREVSFKLRSQMFKVQNGTEVRV